MKKIIVSGWEEENKNEKRELIILKSESKPDERTKNNLEQPSSLIKYHYCSIYAWLVFVSS